ncbi:MAG: hypothetical protein JNM20_04235 [Rhizobiales bacterium]|nr:hypothetical protein [Hyphomicrobiales bacterium]
MQSSLSDYNFRRESRLLLRRMAGGRGYLMPAPEGGFWHLFTKRTGFVRGVAELDGDFVNAMLRARLLVRRPGGGLMAAEAGTGGPRSLRWLDRLDPALVEASERLAQDYERSALGARVTALWDAALLPSGTKRAGGEKEISDAALSARARLHAALEAVGPELSGLLCEVCCLSAGVEQAERRLGLAARSGGALLKVALTRLARHYGLAGSAAPRRRASLKQWGMPDYRPRMSVDP